MFYQQLFAEGLRSEYFKVTSGQNLAGVQADQETTEVTALEATQAFQAKGKEARKKWMKAVDEMGDLPGPKRVEFW